ncbi:sister chromatid cohesion protein PDS5 homolog B-A-like [Thrips palmi]|uniref:Sister chromatid cohesion protein PDS5 homolog B-A-like n=1 Tax=Thrips palmi TaxID=161013 RepID=A0A6P9AF98_THRPL|nr:sister chromatid cohesion protein PDS5 homolog B-A-like [Thrips palmi]
MDDLDDLKKSLELLRFWRKNADKLDSTKRRQIDLVKRQLEALRTRSAPVFSLTWSYGKLLVAEIDQKAISASTLQIILSTFVKSLSFGNLPQIIHDQQILWRKLLSSGNVKGLIKIVPEGGSCLYKAFLTNCLQNMGKSDFWVTMTEYVMASRDTCLLGLINQQEQRETLYEILDILMVQLVIPFSDKAQDAVKCLLNACGYKLADSIREVLNGALISDAATSKLFASHQDVYKIIFALLLINKDLVLGLINNTELCLDSGREDRLDGLEFFCKLFGSKVPGIEKPSEFYSHLWETFLNHCRKTSLLESNELRILAKYTPDILCQPGTHDAWCGLLFYLFQFSLPKKCELHLVSGITTAVRGDLSFLLKSGPKSLPQLIINFLDPKSDYVLSDDAQQRLIKDLSDMYTDAAKTGIMDMSLLDFHETSSWLLSCLLSTCSTLSPRNQRWCMLRKLFVKKLVPYDMAEEQRMKMFLYLWINTDLEEWSILHELFLKTRRTRELVYTILQCISHKDKAQASQRLSECVSQLSPMLISKSTVDAYLFLMEEFFPVLANIPETQKLLRQLVFCNNSASVNFKITTRIKTLFLTRNNIDKEVLDGLLFYLCEITFDNSSMKHLMELVDSCVMGDAVSSAMGENRLHVARTSLRLLNEALFMEPKMGLNDDVLNLIHKWSKLLNGSLSKLALRTLTSLSPFPLGTWNNEYLRENMIPVWFHIIRSGSRGQVKMAIRCVASHSSTTRDEDLTHVFKIISNNLDNPDDNEAFERGVSALGHFAPVCPSALKRNVEDYCTSVLLTDVIKQGEQASCSDSNDSTFSNNTWVDWKELPFHVSIKVQALRSIGRCVRYCGTMRSCTEVLEAFAEILSDSGNGMCHLREVDRDRLRCEAATAVLNVFETAQFHSKISKQLLLLLSNVITDPRIEVQRIFAEKLVQGLCLYKIRSCKIGRRRGKLPPCMLGLLALLGSNVWMETAESEAMAQALLKEVCVSRYIAFVKVHPFSMSKFYGKYPHLVIELIFVAAAPIIAEHSLFQSSWSLATESVFKENVDLALEVSKCFDFVRRMVCHPETYGGQVSNVYLQKVCDNAKQSLLNTVEPTLRKIYSIVFELLDVSLKLYAPAVAEPVTPQVVLPRPFYSEVPYETMGDYVPHLSEADFAEILKYLRVSSKKRKFVAEEDIPEEKEADFDESEYSAQADDSSLNLSPEQSFEARSPEVTTGFPNFGESAIHSTPLETPPRRRRRL